MSGFISTAPVQSGHLDVRRLGAAFHSVDFAMSRIPVARLSGLLGKAARPIGGARRVARLFVPAYEGGISINVQVRRSRNSDARRRLARAFETRRIVS
jgi:hypothetical protein